MHHKFASGVIEHFHDFFLLLLRIRSIRQFLVLFGREVRHITVLLAKYEAHQSVMCPFGHFINQVPGYDR